MAYKNKIQEKIKRAEWRNKNRDKVNGYRKKYWENNKEVCKERTDAWFKKNPDYKKEYRKNNKDRLNSIIKNWWDKHPEKRREYWAKWRKENPEKIKEYQSKENVKFLNKIRIHTRFNYPLNDSCNICKSEEGLTFHHWRYRFPPPQIDFSTLCAFCHQAQHGKTSWIGVTNE